jgi:hypothetical protein
MPPLLFLSVDGGIFRNVDNGVTGRDAVLVTISTSLGRVLGSNLCLITGYPEIHFSPYSSVLQANSRGITYIS